MTSVDSHPVTVELKHIIPALAASASFPGGQTVNNAICTSATSCSPLIGVVSVVASGGSGSYTYAWTAVSNPGSIAIINPSGSSTGFSSPALTPGLTYTCVFKCTVSDGVNTVDSNYVTITVKNTYVGMLATAAFLGGADSSYASCKSGPTCTPFGMTCIVSVTGGSGVYTYAWSDVANPNLLVTTTGLAGLTATFTKAVNTGEDLVGTFRCTVTDTDGNIAVTNIVRQEVANLYVPLAATAQFENGSQTALSVCQSSGGSRGSNTCRPDGMLCTVSVVGGTPPYSYSWVAVSNPSNLVMHLSGDPLGSSVSFDRSVPCGTTYIGVFQCTVTDVNGNTATTNSVQQDIQNTTPC